MEPLQISAPSFFPSTGQGKGQRWPKGPVACSSLVCLNPTSFWRSRRWKAANDALLIHISPVCGVQILRQCGYLSHLHLVFSLLHVCSSHPRQSENQAIVFLHPEPFLQQLREFMSFTKSICSRGHLNRTQPNAASSHEERKAEGSLWWLSGEVSFSGARKLCNSNNLEKKKEIHLLIADRFFQKEIPVL